MEIPTTDSFNNAQSIFGYEPTNDAGVSRATTIQEPSKNTHGYIIENIDDFLKIRGFASSSSSSSSTLPAAERARLHDMKIGADINSANRVMVFMLDPTCPLTVPSDSGGSGGHETTHEIGDYLEKAKRGDGHAFIPQGARMTFNARTATLWLVKSHVSESVRVPSDTSNIRPTDFVAARQDPDLLEPLRFGDFIALNGRLFQTHNLPLETRVDTNNIRAIIVRGQVILFHYQVAMTYFPALLDGDTTTTTTNTANYMVRAGFEPTTVATLIMAMYHDDGQQTVVKHVVDAEDLRRLFAIWLEMNPDMDTTLVDAVWDALDMLVFSA